MIFQIILTGASGGVLRGIMGVGKSAVLKGINFKVNWPWLLVSILVSAIVGIIAASFFGDDLRLALLAGYAGADFIEGLMKIRLKDRFGDRNKGFGELLKKVKITSINIVGLTFFINL